ncbi:MAG: MFS transporter, partial [Actinobacteria bacterium]|nr:MFS transporter [Actinomycetota bacterium]
MVYALSLILGIIGAFDNPARRGLVTELVPQVDLPNAMSLNTAVMTGSRIFGAAIATALVGPLGTGWLFILNGVSYAAMIYGLTGLRKTEMYPAIMRPAGGSPVREVFKYVAGNRRLLTMFLVYVAVSTFSFNFGVALPKLADLSWGDDRAFGWVMSVIGIGNLTGALLTARLKMVSLRWFVGNIALLGLASIGMAFSSNVWLAFLWSIPLGVGGAAMIASGNAISQQESPPDMRGRLLALTAVAFLGSTPIGGPITGLIADSISPERVELHYMMPLAEVVVDFFDQMKNRSQGYASLDYELHGYRESDLVKVDLFLNGITADAFSTIVHREKAYDYGKRMCE